MHTLRKDKSNITRKALEWNPKGRRKSMEAYHSQRSFESIAHGTMSERQQEIGSDGRLWWWFYAPQGEGIHLTCSIKNTQF